VKRLTFLPFPLSGKERGNPATSSILLALKERGKRRSRKGRGRRILRAGNQLIPLASARATFARKKEGNDVAKKKRKKGRRINHLASFSLLTLISVGKKGGPGKKKPGGGGEKGGEGESFRPLFYFTSFLSLTALMVC